MCGRVGLAGHPHDLAGKASRQVEEVQLPDMMGQPTQLADEAGEECTAEARILVHEAIERVAVQDQGLGRLEGDRGRGVRLAIEQRELAEEVSGAEGGDDGPLLALGVRQDDLHRAGLDHVERVPGVTLMEDRLVASIAPAAQRVDAAPQRRVVDAREEGAPTQRLSGIHPHLRRHTLPPAIRPAPRQLNATGRPTR